MTINGQKQNQSALSLVEYLKAHNLKPEYIAVELNGKIVPKEAFATLVFKQDDKVEIVSFVGGG